jgi:hypothetical protein
MSTGLSQVTIIDFDAQVKAAYQKAGLLRPHVYVKQAKAGQVEFRNLGKGIATPRVPQGAVTPMNLQYTKPRATMQDWIAAEYTDVFDEAKTNVDERSMLAETIAAAVGRREDQIIIDALDAAGAPAIVAGGTGMTWDKIRRAIRIFDQRAVPQGRRKFVISARGKEDLLNDNRFLSSDFVGRRAVETGELPPIGGFQWVVMEDRDEGGLPLVSTTRTNFAFDMRALGLGVALDGSVRVDWIAERTSWLAAQYFSGGAVAIDPLGIIEVETVEA